MSSIFKQAPETGGQSTGSSIFSISQTKMQELLSKPHQAGSKKKPKMSDFNPDVNPDRYVSGRTHHDRCKKRRFGISPRLP